MRIAVTPTAVKPRRDFRFTIEGGGDGKAITAVAAESSLSTNVGAGSGCGAVTRGMVEATAGVITIVRATVGAGAP